MEVLYSPQHKSEGSGSWLRFIFPHPFYSLHGLTFFSYLVARQSATAHLSPLFSSHLFRRELQAVLTLGVILCIKFPRSISYEAFVADAILYSKGFLLMLACILDRRLALWYLLMMAIIFLVCQQPTLKGGNVMYMTPLQLENELLDLTPGRAWLVEFTAVWSTRCVKSSRMFVDLSMSHAKDNLLMASIDLGRFPKAAEKYGISMGVATGQLPTYILFENGNELLRFPELDEELRPFGGLFSKSLIINYFDLDYRLISYLSNRSSKKL